MSLTHLLRKYPSKMQHLLLCLVAAAPLAWAASLSSLCTISNIAANLPVSNFTDLVFSTGSISATPVYNGSAKSSTNFPGVSGLTYCNVTFSYSHSGLGDTVLVQYFLPDPSLFRNRFLTTGGGGLAINSGSTALLQGPAYGAVAGMTDGGFGGFSKMLDEVLLIGNGTLNYRTLFNFAYESIHEMNIIGKQLTKNFYGTSSVYSYYFGCSEGGREGWSQVQRFQDQYDGAVVGAPAFRQAYQQVNHLTSAVIEQTMGYAPPPCELEKIMNDTIAACDPLDGKTDGVVSRTDLCKLHYNMSSSVGQPYYCAATGGGMGMRKRKRQMGGSPSVSVAQNGTVTAQGAAVAAAIIDGLHDSSGRQVYISYQPSASFDDAQTAYNSTTGQWYVSASGIGTEWITLFLDQNSSEVFSLDGVTYDTLRQYILTGLQKYSDTLQTVWPDLTDFQSHGGKVIHYHGESDFSVPTDSSVIYQESVRRTMYPNMTYNASYAAMDDWYRLFLIPGAGHCSPSDTQPNGPWPQDTLGALIQWVEKGITPQTLNGTVLQGANLGQTEQICSFPLRPSWSSNSSDVQCVYPDEDALGTWYPYLNSIPFPVY